MADEPQVLRGIDWREVFPFTHIFRAFRIAVHPSKLVLALAAVLCLYFGGRILDAMWVTQYRAVLQEVQLYERSPDRESFQQEVKQLRESAANAYSQLRQQVAGVKGKNVDVIDESDVRYWISSERQKAVDRAYDAHKAKKDADKDETAVKTLRQNIQTAYLEAAQRMAVVDSRNGRGLFAVFFDYERQQVRRVADSVLAGNWLGGLGIGGSGSVDGVYKSALKFFTTAPAWAIRYHWVYFLLYGALFLFVWSLFGGAICRIAAVHVADEGRKLSMRQGLSFAVSKFLSFLSAPLIPMIIVVGLGLVVAVISGLLFLVYLDVAVGVFYFLALAAGFVMTLVVLGTAGGLNLMYPTIAVEGSDSFDAISRSFSYVYAKPWRMLFYSTVAVAYGALCYLFVRTFVWLMLVVTHMSVGLFVYRHANNGNYLWPTMQPIWGSLDLPRGVNFEAMNWYGDVTAGLLQIWVYLVIAMLAAFAVSFYFSASTIIYYLIRRDTDATELDDVYLEQPEEDFAEAGVGAVAAATPGDGTPTAESGPAATPTVSDETMAPPSASGQTPTK